MQNILLFFPNIKEVDALIIVFQVIGVPINIFVILVFIEIIELNFLGLSKMTKRNFELRAKLEGGDDINYFNIEK